MHKSGLITVLMITGLIGGCLLGHFVLFDEAQRIGTDHWTREIGTLVLIRPLMLLIIPLVFLSVTLGVCSIGDPTKLGLIGGSTLLYYVCTMLAAAMLGATAVTIFQPGALPDEARLALTERAESDYRESEVYDRVEQARAQQKDTMGGAWLDLVNQMIPTNIVKEAAEGKTLGVITFSLVFGLALVMGGARTQPVVTVLDAAFDAVMRLVGWVIWLAPAGVFLLVSWSVGRVGLDSILGSLGKFAAVVVGSLLVFGFVILPVILAIFGRANPYRFAWRMRRALLTGFGTASSSATLPVTLENCEGEGGCSRRATNFVVPLGATVNMNGTALFEAVAVVFLCQLYDIDLAFREVVFVVITAALAAIGAAGIPAAGLVTMVIVIKAVNVSLESRGQPTLPESAIGVIVGIDRFLDMCRTTLNVWGDAVGAKIITRIAPDPAAEVEA